MKAFAIASSDEWEGIKEEYKNCNVDYGNSPYGEYFILKEENVLFYRSMARKAYSSAACQWFIDHFRIDHLYVIGTCAGINTELEELEILQFKKCYQSDVVLEELSGRKCVGEIELCLIDKLPIKQGVISTQDKPIILKEDADKLNKEKIDCADMESAAVASICQLNNIPCTVIKGISDFAGGIEGFTSQVNKYEENTKIIMKRICKEIIPVIIKTEEK